MIKQPRGAIIVNKYSPNMEENWTLFTILPPPDHEGEDWPLVEEAIREWYEGNELMGCQIQSITRFPRNPCNRFEIVMKVTTGEVTETETVQYDYGRVSLFKFRPKRMIQQRLF